MNEKNHDIVIIGSGPGGYVAAIRAAQIGLNVAVVENKDLGGVCLNWGCIPTKSLLRTSEIYEYLINAKEFGLEADVLNLDTNSIVKRSRDIAKKLSKGIDFLFKKNNISLILGKAQIDKDKNVIVEKKDKEIIKLFAKNVIIATGASPNTLPFINSDKRIWNYMNAMTPTKVPKKLCIIGSGAIGIEFASFYNALGAEVSVFETQTRILPNEDHEISNSLEMALKERGIKFYKNTEVKDIINEKKLIVKTLNRSKAEEKNYDFNNILVAVGVKANIKDLGLEYTDIIVENKNIKIHECGKTNDPKFYAIGDVAGGPWLAHKASHEGILCVENIAGLKKNHIELKDTQIPSCVYSRPQVASIGITEEQAKKKSLKIKIGKFPLSANGKALSLSETEGFVKTIFDSNTGEILGAHLIGAEVTELISSFALAIKLEATEKEILETIFPHPTISESIHESVLNAFDKSIHI